MTTSVRAAVCLVLIGAAGAYSRIAKAQLRPVEKVEPQTLSVLDQPGAPVRVGASYHNDTSLPLRDMLPASYFGQQEKEENENPKIPHTHVDGVDTVVQAVHFAAPGTMPATDLNFDGIPFPGVTCNCAPPDTNGEVGLTQYVQIANTGFQVFDKGTGASVYGPVSIATIWSGFGGVCQNNGHGDPVVLYDQISNRWIVSQFAGSGVPTDECVAVSTTGDAAGSYFRYGFHLGSNFFDYPHLGVLCDGFVCSLNL